MAGCYDDPRRAPTVVGDHEIHGYVFAVDLGPHQLLDVRRQSLCEDAQVCAVQECPPCEHDAVRSQHRVLVETSGSVHVVSSGSKPHNAVGVVLQRKGSFYR